MAVPRRPCVKQLGSGQPGSHLSHWSLWQSPASSTGLDAQSLTSASGTLKKHWSLEHTKDIQKFFGIIPSGKKPASETVKKNDKTKSAEETESQKRNKGSQVNSSCKENYSKQKQPNKKKRIIYDSDSESKETVQVKKKSQNTTRKIAIIS